MNTEKDFELFDFLYFDSINNNDLYPFSPSPTNNEYMEMDYLLNEEQSENIYSFNPLYSSIFLPSVLPSVQPSLVENKEVEDLKEIEKRKHQIDSLIAICNKRKQLNNPNDFYFTDLFNMNTYLKDVKTDFDIEFNLAYEIGTFSLVEHISKLKCTKLNNDNNCTSYGLYIVDLLYPIVYYSGNVARSLKHLKDKSQIVMVDKKHYKRVLTLIGCLELFFKLKYTKKTRSEEVINYMTLVEELIYYKFPSLKYTLMLFNSISSNSLEDENIKEYPKRPYTSWTDYYHEIKKLLSQQLKHNKDAKFTFPIGYKNTKLIKWCILQKSKHTNSLLSEKRTKLLESLKGWHWGIYSNIDNPKSKLKWDASFHHLKLYLNEINNEQLYFNFGIKHSSRKLYKWCISQKKNVKKGILSCEKIEKLNNLKGWHWGSYLKSK